MPLEECTHRSSHNQPHVLCNGKARTACCCLPRPAFVQAPAGSRYPAHNTIVVTMMLLVVPSVTRCVVQRLTSVGVTLMTCFTRATSQMCMMYVSDNHHTTVWQPWPANPTLQWLDWQPNTPTTVAQLTTAMRWWQTVWDQPTPAAQAGKQNGPAILATAAMMPP